MASFSNFGEQFAAKTLRKFYQRAVFPAITNDKYEGDIKKAGDRVNILSFLHDIALEDYAAGTDMTVQALFDTEDTLIVEKRKSYSFAIDRLEDLFTYVDDASDTLVEEAAKTLEREIDSYVLQNVQFAKAGSWVGTNFRVVGSSADTEASIATTATGGTITVMSIKGSTSNRVAAVENPADGNLYFSGFTTADTGKPIRLTSGATWATDWYRITGVTDSVTVTVTNWDGAIAGETIPNGDILRGLYGGYPNVTSSRNGDGKPTTQAGWGWEIQAAIPTTISASTVYEQLTELAQRLDDNEIPDSDRHVTGPSQFKMTLLQASELQPSGIEMLYDQTVVNGRVARVAGFDVHVAAGVRVSTRAGHATGVAAEEGADTTVPAGATTYQIMANHISFCTFAYKWAESRIVDAENQFAKKYQGLHLWGALVPALRRRAGACLFGTF